MAQEVVQLPLNVVFIGELAVDGGGSCHALASLVYQKMAESWLGRVAATALQHLTVESWSFQAPHPSLFAAADKMLKSLVIGKSENPHCFPGAI